MKIRIVSATMIIAAMLLIAVPRTVFPAEAGGIQIHGFVSQGYLYSGEVNFIADTKDGTAEFNEIGVNFSAQPADRLRIGLQLFSRDLGDISNNTLQVDWAVADYQVSQELGIRVGILKTPRGLSHDQIDLDMTRNTVFLPLATYDPVNRDLYMNVYGTNLYGNIDMGPIGSLDYVASAGTQNPNVGLEGLQAQLDQMMNIEEVGMRWKYGGRLIWNTPLEGFMVGGSFFRQEGYCINGSLNEAFTAPIPAAGGMSLYPAGTKIHLDSEDVYTWYVFSQLAVERLTITGEMYRLISDWEYTTSEPFNPALAPPGFNGFPPTEIRYGGWYAQIDYQVSAWLAAAVAYSEELQDWDQPLGSETNDPFYSGFRRDTTTSLRFDLSPNWNIKLEAHFMDGTYKVLPGMQEDPDDINRYWNLYAVKTSFYF